MKIVCHDCGCEEGQLHKYGCDNERCPFCGHQLLTCGCCYTELGYNYDFFAMYSGLPKEIYENGLSDEEYDKWIEILEDKGRVPYIRYPILCCKCGKLWPDLFSVTDDEWNKYIEPNKRREVICKECFDKIKYLIDKYKGTKK